MINSSVYGSERVGGLIGNRNPSNNNTVFKNIDIINSTIEATLRVGGVFGEGRSSSTLILLENITIYNSKIISSDPNLSYLGGVIGISGAETIITSTAINAIISGSGSYVGGISGWFSKNATLKNVSQAGTVIGETAVGGVIGYVAYTYTANLSNISVSSVITGNSNVGGITGRVYGTVTGSSISALQSSTQIQHNSDDAIGTIIGYILNGGGVFLNSIYTAETEEFNKYIGDYNTNVPHTASDGEIIKD